MADDRLAAAERRGAERVRDRLIALAAEHPHVVDGIEYVEWSRVLSVLEEELDSLSRGRTQQAPGPGDEGDHEPSAR